MLRTTTNINDIDHKQIQKFVFSELLFFVFSNSNKKITHSDDAKSFFIFCTVLVMERRKTTARKFCMQKGWTIEKWALSQSIRRKNMDIKFNALALYLLLNYYILWWWFRNRDRTMWRKPNQENTWIQSHSKLSSCFFFLSFSRRWTWKVPVNGTNSR